MHDLPSLESILLCLILVELAYCMILPYIPELCMLQPVPFYLEVDFPDVFCFQLLKN